MMPELLNYEECAKLFPGKPARWVRDFLVRQNRVDVVKLGRDRFVVKASLEKLVARSTRKGHEFAFMPERVARMYRARRNAKEA